MKIEEVKEMATGMLVRQGHHAPMVLMETKKGMVGAVVQFGNSKEKESAIEFIRQFVSKNNVLNYFTIFEGYMSMRSTGDLIIKPRRDKKRKEVLVITEFRRDMKNKGVFIEFKKVDGGIKIGKSGDLGGEYASIWNVYLEKEGIDERLDKANKENIKAFAEKELRGLTKEFKERWDNIKTEEELEILKKDILLYLKDRREYWRNQIREDDKDE